MKESRPIQTIRKSIFIIYAFTDEQVQIFNRFVHNHTYKGSKCRDISKFICKNLRKWEKEELIKKLSAIKKIDLENAYQPVKKISDILNMYMRVVLFREKRLTSEKEKIEMVIKEKLALFDFYYENKISIFLEEAFIELKDSLNKYLFRGEFFYKMKHEVSQREYWLNTRFRSNQYFQDNGDTYTNLDYYYLFSTLKTAAWNLNEQIEKNLYPQVNLLILKMFPIKNIRKEKGIYIWYLAVQFLQSKVSFEELYVILQKNSGVLSKDELRNLFTLLENFLKKDTSNFKGFFRYKKLIDLYDLQLKKGIIEETQTLVPNLFNNIITVALRLKGEKEKDYIQWTEDFLINYYSKIVIGSSPQDEKWKAIMKSYNEACILFARGKFDKAFSKIEPIIKQDKKKLNPIQKISIERLNLKVLYELNDFEAFIEGYNRLEKYINDKKNISKDIPVDANKTMMKLSKKLIKNKEKIELREFPKEEDLKNIKKEITDTPSLYEREWLLEKWEEINKQS